MLVAPDLAKHSKELSIDLKQFLVFRNLKAVAVLDNGMVLGRRTA